MCEYLYLLYQPVAVISLLFFHTLSSFPSPEVIFFYPLFYITSGLFIILRWFRLAAWLTESRVVRLWVVLGKIHSLRTAMGGNN